MKIDYSPKSINDLQNLKDSIMDKFYDEDLVKVVISDITKNIRKLEIFPGMGKKLIISGNVMLDIDIYFAGKIIYFIESKKNPFIL